MNKQLLQLYKNDPNKPKTIIRAGKFSKAFLKWNRKQIAEGKTTHYAKPNVAIRIGKDGRTYENKITNKLKKKNTITNSVLSLKSNTLHFSYVYLESKNEYTDTLTLSNNMLLRELINRNNIKGSYRLIIKTGKTIIIDTEAMIDSDYWKNNYLVFQKDSDSMIWNSSPVMKGDKVDFIFTKEFILSHKYFEQRFLDGVNHCFFHPITQHFQKVHDDSKSKSVKKNCMAVIHKVNGKTLKTGEHKQGLIKKYLRGIPENEIEKVCEILQIGVDIAQPFCSNFHFSYRCNKKPKKVFKFINTRLNHIEKSETKTSCDSLFKVNEPEIVSRKQLNAIKKNLDENNELCIYKKGANGIVKIQTLTNVYELNNDFNVECRKFEDENGLFECSINRKKDPELCSFIDSGTHFNGTVDFKNTDKYRDNENIPDNMKHIDMKKAYTQFTTYSGYEGFLGKITDFRECDKISQIGLYYITEVDFSKCNQKFINLNKKTQWVKSYNVYPSPELKLFQSFGVSFKITHGAYGYNKDFKFNDTMINTKDKIELGDKFIEIPYYSKWTGFISMKRSYKSFYMNGKPDFFKAINPEENFNIMMTDDNEARIHYPVKYSFTKKHIAAFIISYQRCIMLQQLMDMNIDKVVRICCDGIYYEDHKFNMKKSFTEKEGMTFRNCPAEEYLSNILHNENEIVLPTAKPREFYSRELFKGPGGNGKTYYNLFLDTGLVNKVYIAHSNKLNSTKSNEYEKKFNKPLSTSLHNRLLKGPYQKFDTSMYSNYIIDECSMINEEDKQAIFQQCKGRVIMCGDIGFQLPAIQGEEMTEKGFDNVIELSTNYRFKDEKTLNFMNEFRKNIVEEKSVDFLKVGLQTITKEELKKKYKKEDIILAPFHVINNEYTSMFSHIEKYKVTENRRKYKNGDIVFEKPNQKCELRHGFTIHSVQGEDYENNIYISNMCPHFHLNRMFYTAISRTRTLDQIFIIS